MPPILFIGRDEAKQSNIYALSLILDVDEGWLMSADIPMECIEDIINIAEINSDMLQYFGLKVKGNSMNSDYLDGEVLILEKVDDFNSGDDCVIMVNQ